MTADIDDTCFCYTEAWSVMVWSVELLSGRNDLTVSTILAGGFLVSVTLTVWKVGSAGFSNVSANKITSSRENLSDDLASKSLKSLSIEDLA